MLFTACTLDNIGASIAQDEEPNIVASITLDQTSINFDEHADSQTIYFTSALDWTAELVNDRADSWCSISATSGKSGNGQITVNVTDNTSPDNRTASIIIKSGPISKTVRISQKQKNALTVTASSFELESTSGKIYIEVKANIDFEYTINGTAEDWITPVNTRAMKTSKLGFNIAENNSLYSREGTITIHSGDMQEVVNVYQHGNERGIVISQKEFVISNDGDEISVEVSSNLDIEIEMPDVDWITRNTSRAVSTNTYYFTIAENTSYDQREAYISFINKEKKVSEQVKITQAQKDAIVLAANQYNVNSDGEQITIEIGHNVDFDYEIVGEWITKVETRALTTDYLTFNIAPNTSYDSREGSIIFTSKDGSLSQTAKIFQAQKDAVIISDDDIVINNLSQQVSFEIEANVEYSVSEPDANWVHLVSTRALTSRTLTYDIDENTTHDSREAHIVVTNKTNNSSQTITITQAQKDAIVLAASTYEIDMEGGALDFDIMTNVEVSVSISDNAKSWITHLSSRALQTKTLHFDIAEYDSDDTREGIITLSGGGVTQTVTISQRGVIELGTPNNNEIYYISKNKEIINPNMGDWNETIVSNIYDKELGYGIITFNGNIETIGGDSFRENGALISIKIPESVTEIGGTAFYICTSLKEINIPQSVTKIGDVAFASCVSLTDITIPEGVTQIEFATFCDCLGLKNINLPESVTKIGDRAFEQCRSLTNVTIPANVTEIGESTFKYCENLAKISFEGNKVKSIKPRAFRDCTSLTDINLLEGITEIGDEAFRGCSALTSINIPTTITTIGNYAFDCENLKEFKGKLASNDGYCIIIDGNLRTFVHGSGLTEYTIPDNVTTIGECAFESCGLTNITIPDNVTAIGRYSFRWGKFTSITIPKNVTWIGEQAFAYSNLTSLYCLPITPPTAELSNIIDRVNCTIYVPTESVNAYKTADTWKELANKIVGYDYENNGDINLDAQIYYTSSDGKVVNPSTQASWGNAGILSNTYEDGQGVITFSQSLTEIGDFAFDNCTSLTSIVIPNSVTKIANSAFQYCSNLTNVSMSENLEILGEKAFWNCTSLSSIIIPDGVKEISYDAFSECHNLSEVSLGSGVETIGSHAFYSNYALTAINLPNTVKTIEVNAFANCSNLKSITIPAKVTSIGGWAFYNCSSLTSVTLGSNLETINDWAFHLCTSLTSINIPDSVKTIGSNVFDDCYALATVTLSNSLEYIGDRAFNNCESLTQITIPNSVKTIGGGAFYDCI